MTCLYISDFIMEIPTTAYIAAIRHATCRTSETGCHSARVVGALDTAPKLARRPLERWSSARVLDFFGKLQSVPNQ